MSNDPYKLIPATPEWVKEILTDDAAKRERAEIALRFAVMLTGTIRVEVPQGTELGNLADENVKEFAEVYARWSFYMADAFLAARDGAK